MAEELRMDNEKLLLKQYYAGQQIESPNGGFLMLLGSRPSEDGAIAIFECSATSMRYQVLIPKATRTERKKVKAIVDAGDDPDCPRHGPSARLARAGNDLVCSACGIPYGRA